MNLRFFIDRPVFSIVISVTIVLLGIIALTTLSVEQYPDIAPPTVQVTTSYPGANAETVQKAVIVPLEEAINGVENMSYIHSEASNTGEVTVNVYFRQGVDADMAAVNVQNRVSKAQGLLPAEVTTGMRLTENWMIDPGEALCGLMLSDADYFSVGTIDAQQLEEYADRRGMTAEDVKKIIPNNV